MPTSTGSPGGSFSRPRVDVPPLVAITCGRTDLGREVLEALEQTGWIEAWMPLAHALAARAGAGERLASLSSEMADLTRLVLQRIESSSASQTVSPEGR